MYDDKPVVEHDYILCPACDKVDNTGLWLDIGTNNQSAVIWCSCGAIIKYAVNGELTVVGNF